MMHLRPLVVHDEDDPTMVGFDEFFGVVIPPEEAPPPQPPEEEAEADGDNARNRPRERSQVRRPPFPGSEDVSDETNGVHDSVHVIEPFSINVTPTLPPVDYDPSSYADDDGNSTDSDSTEVWEPVARPAGPTVDVDGHSAQPAYTGGGGGGDEEIAAMSSRRVRGRMYNDGYADGAAAGAAAQAQPGCDAGYQFGAAIGRASGWILGLLSVLAALADVAADEAEKCACGEDHADDDDIDDIGDDSGDGGVLLPSVLNPAPRSRRAAAPGGGRLLPAALPRPEMRRSAVSHRPTMTSMAPRDDWPDEELGFGPPQQQQPPRRRRRSTYAGGVVLDEDALARHEALTAIRTRRSDLRRGCRAAGADGSPTQCINALRAAGVGGGGGAAAARPPSSPRPPPPPLPPGPSEAALRAERFHALEAAAREQLTKERLWEPRLLELARATPEAEREDMWDGVAWLHPVVVRWHDEAERAMRELALGLADEDGDDDDEDWS